MPKNKVKSAAKKRFKVTGTGKIKKRRSGISHLLSGDSAKQKRSREGEFEVSKSAKNKVKRMLGLK